MTKFIIGLLLGLIVGIGGTATFLISAGGGDYLVGTSPRVRDLESSLKNADQEREWLRGQLRDSSQMIVKLESRFIALATRFEDLGSHAATLLGAPPTADETSDGPPATGEATAPAPQPTATPMPTQDPTTPTPQAADAHSTGQLDPDTAPEGHGAATAPHEDD